MNKDDLMEVKSVVRRAMEESLEMYDEQWVTGEELCRWFQMFTKDWLKRYGHALPRVQAVVAGVDGAKHKTGWAYPRHKIARMVQNGEIRQLRCKDTMTMMTERVIGGMVMA